MSEPRPGGRLRNLPDSERVPFEQWLIANKKTKGLIEFAEPQDQDGYFQDDYEEWKRTTR